jgi:hypothetical protein
MNEEALNVWGWENGGRIKFSAALIENSKRLVVVMEEQSEQVVLQMVAIVDTIFENIWLFEKVWPQQSEHRIINLTFSEMLPFSKSEIDSHSLPEFERSSL